MQTTAHRVWILMAVLVSGILVNALVVAAAACKTPPAVGVIIDSAGGVYWARAPIGLFTRTHANAVSQYAKSIGLEGGECPTFVIEEKLLQRIVGIVTRAKGTSERMQFWFTFVSAGGRPTKYVVGKDTLHQVIEVLRRNESARLRRMYDIADKVVAP